MTLLLLAIGRLRPHFRAACDDYLRRLGHYLEVREIEVRETGKAATPAVARRQEGERLAARIPAGALVVALDRTGRGWSSEDLAREIARWRDGGRTVVCLIGGSHGLGPEVLERAQIRWSLGPITLPHELARVVAVEQLYRGCTILRGEPYHK